MASPPVNANKPGTPIQWVSGEEITKDTAKVMPMVVPIKAMALVRCSSRVKSASSAINTAEIAPAPCKARPIITVVISCA